MKIAFFGTGEFSKNILSSILKYNKIEIGIVVSQPDKIIGRNKVISKTKIKEFSEKNNIEVIQPEKLKNNYLLQEKLKNYDFFVVVAYGKIIPKEILNLPKYGNINIHGSILPKYRGASPIQEAIKNGDNTTGITIMYISEGMDEGDILDIKEIKIDKLDKTNDIFQKFEKIGPELLIKTLNNIKSGNIIPIKQDSAKATYCSKITKENGEIFFNKENAINIYNKYKAYYSWPGIYTYYKGKKLGIEECCFNEEGKYEKNFLGEIKPGKVVKIDKKTFGIVCKDNKFLIITKIKLEGKKTMDINSFINGNKDFLNYNF